jgi:CBS domain-containing protein
MKVKDVMHKGVDWVSPDTPVSELAKLMREHDIGAIPIGENDRLIGIRDSARCDDPGDPLLSG